MAVWQGMGRFGLGIIAAIAIASGAFAAGRTDSVSPYYPYGKTGTFASFVTESFQVAGTKNPQTASLSFFTYMGSTIPVSMDAAKIRLNAITDTKARAVGERDLCANLHKAIKKQIPRFSLDRGFEFANTVKFGERQCYLQSVVIASLLQRAGVPAGVAMVSRNEKGAYCNNGHAVAIARLADGNDIIVDASDPAPFMTHQGLMVQVPQMAGYAYVEPVYDTAHRITAYRSQRGGKVLLPSAVAMLDVPFLRSQFTYYRGERTPGGLFTPPLVTRAGLAQSEKWLQKSVAECPRNPLAVYMLGRVQDRQGKIAPASQSYNNAYLLYTRYGWVPDAEIRALAAIKKKLSHVTVAHKSL